MSKDPIIEEIHQIRKQLAAEHGDDLQRLGDWIMARQNTKVSLGSDSFASLRNDRAKVDSQVRSGV